MPSPKVVPNPVQLRAYLTAHGWHKGWDIPNTGEMFVFEEPADGGGDITVFVPIHDIWDDYAHSVSAVVDTLAWIERRTQEAVWADLNATVASVTELGRVAPSPTTPASPADPVTP